MLRLILSFQVLLYFFFQPNLSVHYSLIPSSWNLLSEGVLLDSYDLRGLDIVNYGADMQFSIEISTLDRDTFEVFSGNMALCVLNVINELLETGKFIGPLPPHITSWNGEDFIYHRLFVLEKQDSTELKPK